MFNAGVDLDCPRDLPNHAVSRRTGIIDLSSRDLYSVSIPSPMLPAVTNIKSIHQAGLTIKFILRCPVILIQPALGPPLGADFRAPL